LKGLNHASALSAKLSEFLDSGLQCPVERYDTALALARTCRQQLEAVFSDYYILLAPSALGEAPLGLAATGDPVFSRIWTLLHVPCATFRFSKARKSCRLASRRSVFRWRRRDFIGFPLDA
jgi:hypothetical protein